MCRSGASILSQQVCAVVVPVRWASLYFGEMNKRLEDEFVHNLEMSLSISYVVQLVSMTLWGEDMIPALPSNVRGGHLCDIY